MCYVVTVELHCFLGQLVSYIGEPMLQSHELLLAGTGPVCRLS
jgi:hypothetical protein